MFILYLAVAGSELHDFKNNRSIMIFVCGSYDSAVLQLNIMCREVR